MKKLVLTGLVIVTCGLYAQQENGCDSIFKQETNQFITGIKAVGEELYKLIIGDGKKNRESETASLVLTTNDVEIKSEIGCAHCKDLCESNQFPDSLA